MTWWEPVLGLGVGFLVPFVVLGMLHLLTFERKPKKKPVSALQDHTDWLKRRLPEKKRERIEARSRWDTDFYEVDHPIPSPATIVNGTGGNNIILGSVIEGGTPRKPTRQPYGPRDLVMLQAAYGPTVGYTLWKKGWDGKHLMTCPYECDCPGALRGFDE